MKRPCVLYGTNDMKSLEMKQSIKGTECGVKKAYTCASIERALSSIEFFNGTVITTHMPGFLTIPVKKCLALKVFKFVYKLLGVQTCNGLGSLIRKQQQTNSCRPC